MKILFIFFLLILPNLVWGIQKAKIFNPEVEVYSDADFDSEIIDSVRAGESYSISDKTYGPFYRIKLKNGKIGYIVDYEVDVEGKGRVKEQDLDDVMFEQVSELAKETQATAEENELEAQVFGHTYSGPTLQLINFHENTLGADQVDDLLAIGYKKVSDVTWSILGSFKAPQYYADKTGGSAKGLKLWADLGISSRVADFGVSEIRFAGSLFTHVSLIQLSTPVKKYDLHDITIGVALEVDWLIKIKKTAIDLSIKYYFDKTNYAGLGLSFLF